VKSWRILAFGLNPRNNHLQRKSRKLIESTTISILAILSSNSRYDFRMSERLIKLIIWVLRNEVEILSKTRKIMTAIEDKMTFRLLLFHLYLRMSRDGLVLSKKSFKRISASQKMN